MSDKNKAESRKNKAESKLDALDLKAINLYKQDIQESMTGVYEGIMARDEQGDVIREAMFDFKRLDKLVSELFDRVEELG